MAFRKYNCWNCDGQKVGKHNAEKTVAQVKTELEKRLADQKKQNNG